MKLTTFERAGAVSLGAVAGEEIVDLAAARKQALAAGAADAALATPIATDVNEFLAAGEPALAAARAALAYVASLDAAAPERAQLAAPRAELKLLPPVPRPPKIVCVARNYAKHAREAGLEVSEIPILFARFAKTLVADGDPIVRPDVSDQLDWEGELAVVIGQGGRHIGKAEAMDHVAGFTIFNDVTVRDYQFRVAQYTAGKNFSRSGPLGPYLTLRDELPDPHALELRTEINGEQVQHANTAEMIFDVPFIVEHISEFIELEPGDVIAMGTPSGVGFKREPPRFLVPGDRVTVTIEGLGSLSNPVVEEER